jgi:hypothetical protein
MSTVGSVLEQARSELLGGHRAVLNRLDGQVSAGAGSLTLEFDAVGIGAGATLAIEDEVFHVWQVASKTATVSGGQAGTDEATHADGTIVEVNPVAPRGIIRKAMIEEILSWPTSLFGVASESVTLATTSQRTTLATMTAVSSDVRRILDLREYRDDPGFTTFETWPQIRHWEAVYGLTGADTIDLQIRQNVRGGDLWVRYATDFDVSTFTDDTDLVSTVGLSESMEDILRMGTVMRLIPRREVARGRADGQGAPRDAAEVQPGQNTQLAILYGQLRDRRIAEEASRLREKYPERGL